MTKYACPKCTMKRTMSIIRVLCVKSVILVYVCSKCEGVWSFREDTTIPGLAIVGVVKKGRMKTPRFRKDSS